MSKRNRKPDLAQAAVDAGNSLSASLTSALDSAIGSASSAAAAGIGDLSTRGRRARKSARKAARKLREDVRSDVRYRAEGLAAATHGDPKGRGTVRRLARVAVVLGAVGVAGAKLLAARRGSGGDPP